MTATASVLMCQNCGAPLPVDGRQTLAICLYCHTSNSIEYRDGATPVVGSGKLSPAAVGEIVRLLRVGDREGAIGRCQQELQCDRTQAEEIIRPLVSRAVFGATRTQALSARGIVIATVEVAVLVGSVTGAILGAIPVAVAVLLAVVALVLLLLAWSAIRITARYAGAPIAVATVRRRASIGDIGSNAQAVRLWVEVEPRGAPPFQTEVDILVLTAQLWKVDERARIEVKYRPGESAVIVRRLLAQAA